MSPEFVDIPEMDDSQLSSNVGGSGQIQQRLNSNNNGDMLMAVNNTQGSSSVQHKSLK
jgi:hypothetical protein